MSKVKVTILTPEEVMDWDDESQEYVFTPKSKYYIIDALGNYNFYHCRDRLKAQQEVDNTFGKGKYSIRVAKNDLGSDNYTCTGSNSRKGFMSHLRKTV